jgi:CBS-domain-containing membrane protein
MAALLQATTLGTLIFDKKELVQVDVGTKVEDAIKLMKEKCILSVPVFDPEKCQYIGLLDMFDVMRYTTLGIFEESAFRDKLFSNYQFRSATVKEIIERSCRGKILVLEASDPLELAFKNLSENHRALIPMKDENTFKNSYRMITQTDLVRFIQKHTDQLGTCINRRIEEMGLANPLGTQVLSISTKDQALDGFLKMFRNEVNAVAVVDDTGRLVANLSASDLWGISSQNISTLKLPPLQFLKSISGAIASHPVTCSSRSYLAEVIEKLISAKIHRVWVVNSGEEPIGVVTMTDVLRSLIPK